MEVWGLRPQTSIIGWRSRAHHVPLPNLIPGSATGHVCMLHVHQHCTYRCLLHKLNSVYVPLTRRFFTKTSTTMNPVTDSETVKIRFAVDDYSIKSNILVDQFQQQQLIRISACLIRKLDSFSRHMVSTRDKLSRSSPSC